MRRIAVLLVLLLATLSTNVAVAEDIAQGVRVVVIDAGHGGPKYPGANYRGILEKNLNLKVALKLGELIESRMPEVKVVYTRKSDMQFSVDLNEDLLARAEIANKAGGDIFISIHANAARSTSARGVETLVMGESPLEQRVNESVLFANNKEEFLDMSDQSTAAIVRAHIQNMQFTYGEYSEVMARLVQKHYGKLGRVNRGIRKQPLRVLYATDMPSILTEIGFMSNSTELKYITSESGQKELVTAIYNAVKEYVDYVRKSVLVEGTSTQDNSNVKPAAPAAKPQQPAAKPQAEVKPQPATKPQAEVKPQVSSKPKEQQKSAVVRYAIQVMASMSAVSVNDSRFGSYKGKVRQVRADGTFAYKYCVGDYADKSSAQKALPDVRKCFPQAFVIAVKDGKVVK